MVTNLRLSAGQFVNRGQPLLSFIEYGPRWISAAMRENQLGNVAPGNEVLVALDDNPGKLFPGRVESIGWGITQGDEMPTGQLPDVQPAAGWLREPQRFPVRIKVMPSDDGKEAMLAAGRSGAQANVIVFTDPGIDPQSDRQAVDPHRRALELPCDSHGARPVARTWRAIRSHSRACMRCSGSAPGSRWRSSFAKRWNGIRPSSRRCLWALLLANLPFVRRRSRWG